MLLSWAENPPNPPIQEINNDWSLIYPYPGSLSALKFLPIGDNSLDNYRDKG